MTSIMDPVTNHPHGGFDDNTEKYTPVDPAMWGKDHYSMLGYLATLKIDNMRGIAWFRCRVNNTRMDSIRGNGLNRGRITGMGWENSYGTRLHGYWLPAKKPKKGDTKPPPRETDESLKIGNHDDFDCLTDFAQCGEHGYPPIVLYEPARWAGDGAFTFTEIGRTLAMKVLDLKAQGLMFNDITIENLGFEKNADTTTTEG